MQDEMATRIANRAADSSHIAQFPLMKLPRELRNRIYEVVNCPVVEFVFIEHDNVEAPLSYPSLMPATAVDTEYSIDHHQSEDPITPNLQELDDERGLRRQDQIQYPMEKALDLDYHEDGSDHVLAYRLPIIPLALTCKEVHAEIVETMDTSKPRLRDIRSMIKETVHRQRIFVPSPSFLKLCTSSRLILKTGNLYATIYFIQRLPENVKSCFLELVFAAEQLTIPKGDRLGDAAWRAFEANNYPTYLYFLQEQLPNLQSIAIEVPSMKDSIPYYCLQGPRSIAGILYGRRIDVVRFLYRRSLGSTPSQLSPLLNDIVGPVLGEAPYHPGTPPPGFEWEYKDIPREFDGVSEHSTYLGAETVVRITRHKDRDATRRKLVGLNKLKTRSSSYSSSSPSP